MSIGVVTIIGVVFGYLMGGAVVVENVFSWNGLGRLLVFLNSSDSASARCFPSRLRSTDIASSGGFSA